MPADLEAIVAAAKSGDLRLTRHYGEERQGAPDRPWYSEIVYGLAHDAPELVGDDRGVDGEGAVCRITCMTSDSNAFEVRINYQASPMRIVTAFRLGRGGRDA